MPEEGQREERVAQGLHRQLQEHVSPPGKMSTMPLVVMGRLPSNILNHSDLFFLSLELILFENHGPETYDDD